MHFRLLLQRFSLWLSSIFIIQKYCYPSMINTFMGALFRCNPQIAVFIWLIYFMCRIWDATGMYYGANIKT